MIQSAKYNGINFSYDFTRQNDLINFDNQRVRCVVNRDVECKHLSFFSDGVGEVCEMTIYNESGVLTLTPDITSELTSGWIFYFIIPEDFLFNGNNYAKLNIDSEFIYSEIFIAKSTNEIAADSIVKIVSSNDDDRFGFLENEIFGFFKVQTLNSDIFLNKKTEYEYSYSRKKILSSENQIGKRFTFLGLSMYQQNLLKWLCNCQNVAIDGVSYQLISDFTELEKDLNSEIFSLQADFVEVSQSFFGTSALTPPKNVFIDKFFM